MKAEIRTKKRIRGRDWDVFIHPDEKKKAFGGLVAETTEDALTSKTEGSKSARLNWPGVTTLVTTRTCKRAY
jgi:hypothetical protein